MHFPLYERTASEEPQKIQKGEYFFRIILLLSVKISSESHTLMSITRLNSFGITIRPNSSTLLTIPVAFIIFSPYTNPIHHSTNIATTTTSAEITKP